MKVIELTKGQVAIVDDEDFERVAQWRWQCVTCPDGLMYARRSQYLGGGASNCKLADIRMHHLILPQKSGFVVDHKNGNGLDNRRENIRYATSGQNRANSKTNKNSQTGIKGVSYRPKFKRPWVAAIASGDGPGKKKHLGYFNTPEEASAAYVLAAKERFGEFTRSN